MSHDATVSSPYRKVSVCAWSDAKVRRLTPIQPSGQSLFLMLMVGGQTTNIPGLQPVGRMAFAEMLGWELEAFDEAFAEVFAEGLAEADWKARLIFVPNAIKHNLPQSPNVVKSWAATWAVVPECALKSQAWRQIYAALCALGESFAEAFKAACPLGSEPTAGEPGVTEQNHYRKPSAKATGKATDNQEQEQEQEQEVNQTNGARAPVASLPAADPCPHQEIIAAYHELLPTCTPVKVWNDLRKGLLRQRWREEPKRQRIEWWRRFFGYVAESRFLTGQADAQPGRDPFVADLEWLIRPQNFAKVIEGKYHQAEVAA